MYTDYITWGDCLNVMAVLPDNSIDCILCDLPYSITGFKWDSIIPFDKLWEQYIRIIKDNGAIVLNSIQPFTSKLILSNPEMYRYSYVWDKGRASNFMSAKVKPLIRTEDICVFSKATANSMSSVKMKYYPQGLVRVDKKVKNGKNVGGQVAVAKQAVYTQGKEYIQEFTNYPNNIIQIVNDSNPLHPTQKPIALCEYLIKTYTQEGEIVLDNCCGSGTTCLAAKNTGRHYIGIEKDENYFNIAKNRLENDYRNLLRY